MKAAIAGGAGRQSLAAIYDLAERGDVEEILLIDRNEDALRLRKELVHSDKVKIKAADITDVSGTAKILAPYDAVLNASSHIFNMHVMDACLEAKTHYTDLGGLFHWALDQLKRHDDFKKAGITGIVGSGSAPGIVNALTKYATDRLDTVESILILDAIINPSKGYAFFPPYALNTIIEEFTMNNFEFADGKLKELPPFSGKLTVDFPEPYGRLNLYNMIHSEVATMPLAFREKGIKNVAFKLALPPLFEERLRFLIENGMTAEEKIKVGGVEVAPRDFTLAMFETKPEDAPGSNRGAATPQDAKLLRVIADGTKNGKNVGYEMDCDLHHHPWNLTNGFFSVGFPAAVTTWMLGSGLVSEKGFFSGESVLDTDIYFRELGRRDVHAFARVTEKL
jgi:saccharopine dehydrogenase-like NADP-dependent oxidoreductase